jgi:hypothetical protein
VVQLQAVSSQLSVKTIEADIASELALTLFMLGVFADDANHAAAVDDFALVANLLD